MRYSMIAALIAALQGAAGVSLAGAAAHVEASPLLSTASQFLMTHAAVGLALASFLVREVPYPGGLRAEVLALQTGVALFATDLVARSFLGGKLFAYAAPIGGGLTILAWLGLVIWAALSLRQTK